jgi:hypothetical protein
MTILDILSNKFLNKKISVIDSNNLIVSGILTNICVAEDNSALVLRFSNNLKYYLEFTDNIEILT